MYTFQNLKLNYGLGNWRSHARITTRRETGRKTGREARRKAVGKEIGRAVEKVRRKRGRQSKEISEVWRREKFEYWNLSKRTTNR